MSRHPQGCLFLISEIGFSAANPAEKSKKTMRISGQNLIISDIQKV